MKWTKERPTVEGEYWFRWHNILNSIKRVVTVYKADGKFFVSRLGPGSEDKCLNDYKFNHASWSDEPVQLPED